MLSFIVAVIFIGMILALFHDDSKRKGVFALLPVVLLALSGCGKVSENYIRIEADSPVSVKTTSHDGKLVKYHQVQKEKAHYRVLENINGDLYAFHKNPQATGVKHCKNRYTSEQMADLRAEAKTDGEDPDSVSWFYNCDKWYVAPAVVVASTVVEQLQAAIAAAVYSGGFYAGMKALGSGIRDQGGDTNNLTANGGDGGAGGAGGMGVGYGGKGGNAYGPYKGGYKHGY